MAVESPHHEDFMSGLVGAPWAGRVDVMRQSDDPPGGLNLSVQRGQLLASKDTKSF